MAPDIFTYKNPLPQTSTESGVLAGKKVVIQPNMSVCGWLTDAGSLALEGFVALEDATVITRLRNAGASLIGSTRMSELGFGISGDRGTQALCGGEADIALITDTMGEARVAAATSGLFGFKPSYGIISRLGLIGLVPSMECYGIMAKSPEDIIATIGAITGKDENDFSMPDEDLPGFSMPEESPGTKGVSGVIKECLSILNDTELRAFESVIAKIEEAGVTVKEVSLENFRFFQAVHNVIGSVEASSSAGKYDGVRYGHRAASARNWNEMYLNSRGESFGLLVKAFLFQGAYFQFENYPAFENACRIRRRLIRDTEKLFEHIDVLALPTRRLHHDPARAATVRETYDAFLLTLPANVTGQPSLQIPSLGLDPGADPGLQIMSPPLSDARLLATGMRISSIIQGAKKT